jgi:splicing factor 3B subunit 3
VQTQIEAAPTAMCAFQGKLLVGMGPVLRIYAMGKKKLLRKCENKVRPPSPRPTTTRTLHRKTV